jgi:hypothetical protein
MRERGGNQRNAGKDLSSFYTKMNQTHDVLVNRGQHLMQQPLRVANLRICKLYFIPHPRLVDGWGRKPGDPSRYSLNTLEPVALEDLGVGATSPGATLQGTPAPMSCTTMSRIKLPGSSPSRDQHLPRRHRRWPMMCHKHPACPTLVPPPVAASPE